MKKCCFIIPYFGKFNNYFPLFVKSCSYNLDFNWLIITDDESIPEMPENIRVLNWSFSEMQQFVNERFHQEVALMRPYKLCDLKPMYGFLFEEYLSDFMFWGYCDVDIVVGNLRHFITDELLSHYDKLFCLGHMTLIKNTKQHNRVFMNVIHNEVYYKKVLSNEKIMVFDEEYTDNVNINTLFKAVGLNIYEYDYSMNPCIKWPWFRRVEKVGKEVNGNVHGYITEPYRDAVYLWDKGHIKRYYKEKGKIVEQEFMYMHLQQRRMKIDGEVFKQDVVKIMPNRFAFLEYDTITVDNIGNIKKLTINNQYYLMVIKPYIKRLGKIIHLT